MVRRREKGAQRIKHRNQLREELLCLTVAPRASGFRPPGFCHAIPPQASARTPQAFQNPGEEKSSIQSGLLGAGRGKSPGGGKDNLPHTKHIPD